MSVAHRKVLAGARGPRPDALGATDAGTGRCVLLDAAATLAALSVDGIPDRGRFDAVIGSLFRGRRTRAFGEMVGILWDRGDLASAISLESFWNELCDAEDVFLELATNAVVQAGSPFRVTLRRDDGTITVAVHDVGADLPEQLESPPTDPHGRGVAIVAALSAQWGRGHPG